MKLDKCSDLLFRLIHDVFGVDLALFLNEDEKRGCMTAVEMRRLEEVYVELMVIC